MTHKFCSQCNRVRMTSEGYLKACLQYQTGVSLKDMMRTGCSDEELTEAIRKVIWEKPGEHHFTSRRSMKEKSRLMSRSAAENKAGGKGRMAETKLATIVLAGGASSRMGREKSDLLLNGRTFLETQYRKGKQLGGTGFMFPAIMERAAQKKL